RLKSKVWCCVLRIEPFSKHGSHGFGLLHGRHVTAVLDCHQCGKRRWNQVFHRLVPRIWTPGILATANQIRGTADGAQHCCGVRPGKQGSDLRVKLLGTASTDHGKNIVEYLCTDLLR